MRRRSRAGRWSGGWRRRAWLVLKWEGFASATTADALPGEAGSSASSGRLRTSEASATRRGDALLCQSAEIITMLHFIMWILYGHSSKDRGLLKTQEEKLKREKKQERKNTKLEPFSLDHCRIIQPAWHKNCLSVTEWCTDFFLTGLKWHLYSKFAEVTHV